MSRRKSSPRFIKPGGSSIRRGRHRSSAQQASLINECFTATVRDIASDGRAVLSHPSGQTVFVPGLWIGEEANVKITAKKKNIVEGVYQSITTAHPDRITPPCQHHGFNTTSATTHYCGGCPWQFIRYEQQLSVKQQRVEKELSRICDIQPEPIWPSPNTLGYRRRAQLKTNGEVIGFASNESNTLAPINTCPVLSEKNRTLLSDLQEALPNPAWRPKGKQPWRALHIDEDVSIDNITVDEPRLFQQANHEQNIAMKQWLHDKVAAVQLKKSAPLNVLELFSGAGNFTETLLESGNIHITAVDAKGPAIQLLEEKNLPGVTAIARDLYDESSISSLHRQFGPFDVLVVDPPRDGLKNTAGLINKKQRYSDIFYISCNLATFSRDAKVLIDAGYRLIQCQPLDQTPHTPHIEILNHFTKR
ncbi:class I SAM-dependent RNA methyltransferase [Aurantivibrio plasticivorans]